MELRQLRYFLAVAEELHFTRAAERLHVSQPPLTVAVRQLEQELGATLLDRTTRRVRLTAAGEALRDRARTILDEVEAAATWSADVGAGTAGRLRVGFVSSASYEIVPRALRAFRASRPAVRLDLAPLASGEQVEGLLAGEIDVGVVRDADPLPGVRLEPIAEERLVCVLPAGHPLAELERIPPERAGAEPLVLFPYRLMPGYLRRVLELLDPGGGAVRVVQQAVHQETVLGLVAAGIGCSVLPESVERFGMPEVMMRPFVGDPTTTLQIATRTGPAAAERAFAEVLRDVATA